MKHVTQDLRSKWKRLDHKHNRRQFSHTGHKFKITHFNITPLIVFVALRDCILAAWFHNTNNGQALKTCMKQAEKLEGKTFTEYVPILDFSRFSWIQCQATIKDNQGQDIK